MYVSRIVAKDFMSLGEVVVDLPPRGVISVEGENGAGKTALLEAVGFALFGKTLRGLRPGQVARRLGDGTASVRVDFRHENGSDTAAGWIARSVTSAGTQLVTGELLGKKLRGDTLSDTQEQIEARLGLDWGTWRAAFHFASKFAFLGLDDAEKKAILDSLTASWRFDAARERALEAGERIRQELLAAVDEEQKARTTLAVDGPLFWKDLDVFVTLADRIREEMAACEVAETDAATRLQEAKARQVAAETTAAQADSGLLTVESAVAMVRDAVGDDPSARIRASEARLTDLSRAQARQEADLAQAKAGTCPTCGRPGMDTGRVQYLADLVGATRLDQETTTAALQAAVDARVRWLAAQEQVAPLVAAREHVLRARDDARHEATAARAEVQVLARSMDDAVARFASAKARLAQSTAPSAERLSRMAASVNTVRTLATKRAVLTERQKIAAFWAREGFARTGIKSYLLELVVPLLNERLSIYTRDLSDGQMSIRLSAVSATAKGEQRDRIGVLVENADGGDILEGNSGGERARYDLAVMAAFSDLARDRGAGAGLTWLCLDEVFDHIDQRGRAKAAAFLRALGETRQVLFVAHWTDIADKFDHHVRLVKHAGTSAAAAPAVPRASDPVPVPAKEHEHANVVPF